MQQIIIDENYVPDAVLGPQNITVKNYTKICPFVELTFF